MAPSATSSKTITCPSCKAKQRFKTWPSLSADDEAQKKKFIAGDLNCYVCKKCGWASDVIYPVVYTDVQRRLMIRLWPGEKPPTEKSAVEIPAGAWHLRVVATRDALIEKMCIAEVGYDDRVIEFLKLIVYSQAEEAGKALAGILVFTGKTKAEDGAETIEFAHLMEKKVEAVSVPVSGYDFVEKALKAHLAVPGEADREWIKVDADWAVALVRTCGG